jgi:hypothetical protein
MSANTYLRVTELDFEEIRTNLKTYLSTQTEFEDYDFEGSAMSVLLDLLAYNTHYNAFYVNMLANEMFLDTAQQRDSVVSFAKSLGYVPVSAIGATANVQLTFNGIASTVSQVTVPKNSKFTTTIDDITYTYVTPQAYQIDNNEGVFTRSINIKEGIPLSQRYTVDFNSPQRYIIPNENVDMTSITVKIQESSADVSVVEYTRATNITQVFSTSAVYFIEEIADSKFEIIFGQGALGKALKNGNIVIIDYLVCNGNETNGATAFSIDTLNIGINYTFASITTNSSARSGRPKESIESIKFNAPRNFQTQNRCIIDNDYQRILLAENPDLQSVIAFGGEQATPPVYGKVFIAIKPFGENFVTSTRKQELRRSIIDRTPLAVDPVFIDADFIYILPTVRTFFDTTKTRNSENQIARLILNGIDTFAEKNLYRFGNKFRFSRFANFLDDIDPTYILNNDISIRLQKRLTPNIQRTEKLTIEFNSTIRPSTLTSGEFTYAGFKAYVDDNGEGIVRIYRFNAQKQKVFIIENTGTIDYTSGTVIIENFAIQSYPGIELYFTIRPDGSDVTPIREQILIMDSNDAIVTAVGENP